MSSSTKLHRVSLMDVIQLLLLSDGQTAKLLIIKVPREGEQETKSAGQTKDRRRCRYRLLTERKEPSDVCLSLHPATISGEQPGKKRDATSPETMLLVKRRGLTHKL
ncbi:hypothetical protein ACFX2J_002403 [Malus domestica]